MSLILNPAMARLFRSLRKTLINQIPIQQQRLCISPSPSSQIISRRTYISQMRKEAFEGNISRLLRNEIQYELQTSSPSNPVSIFFFSCCLCNGFLLWENGLLEFALFLLESWKKSELFTFFKVVWIEFI